MRALQYHTVGSSNMAIVWTHGVEGILLLWCSGPISGWFSPIMTQRWGGPALGSSGPQECHFPYSQ